MGNKLFALGKQSVPPQVTESLPACKNRFLRMAESASCTNDAKRVV